MHEQDKVGGGYAALGCISNFSFLRGASHPHELIETAAVEGWSSCGIADYHTISGLVRAHQSAIEKSVKLLCGVRLIINCSEQIEQSEQLIEEDRIEVIIYAKNRTGYESLSQLLSRLNMALAHIPAVKRATNLYIHVSELARLSSDVFVIIEAPELIKNYMAGQCQQIQKFVVAPLLLGSAIYRDGNDKKRLKYVSGLAARLGLRFIALAAPLYHHSSRRPLADVLYCIRTKQTLATAGRELSRNAERHLMKISEYTRLWSEYPEAIMAASQVAQACSFSLSELSYEYPEEIIPNGRSVMDELIYQTWQGAERRYPDGIPNEVNNYLKKELALIAKLNYAPYFLTVFDIVRFARSRNILCQGRGSAANSAVCYCLDITAVDPARSSPLFERFVSEARAEPPDIDVDFEHERREEIIQYIYNKYGRHRAGIAASIVTYRKRSALIEVAKVFGLSRDIQQALSAQVWDGKSTSLSLELLCAAGLDPEDTKLQLILKLVQQLHGFPRHLSQHVGGFVIAKDRLDSLCVIRPASMDGRTIIEWDKNDLEALGLLKVDILALGMLSCLRRAFDLLKRHYHLAVTLSSIPAEDIDTYNMLCEAQSVGVFQVESRAQMSMLPRLQPRCFHDLVVQVAIVRPGPIQGDMVHPYLRRRSGYEKIIYPSDELKQVLQRTLGVPLFQEQAMQIAIVAAGFSGSEADQLRRAMATFRRNDLIHTFKERMIKGMVERGYQEEFAIRCFRQIEGFGTYGFPESHAASFALLVYASAWIKCHYPDVFICALLNAQPMGFYSPAQLVAEAKRSGVEVRPIDINNSQWDCSLESTGHSRHALRLGMRQVKGLKRYEAERLTASRHIAYQDINDLIRKSDISIYGLESLARADAFHSIGLTSRQALWEIKKLARQQSSGLPLFLYAEQRYKTIMPEELKTSLPIASLGNLVAQDYLATGLSLKAHPVTILEPYFLVDGWHPCSIAIDIMDGKKHQLIGLVTGRQMPGTAKGTVFITLEDAHYSLNVIVWPAIVRAYRAALLGSHLLGVSGRIQKQGKIIHLIADKLVNCDLYLQYLRTPELKIPILKSRNFH
ncbi:MAG: error-prone DNA polymerase 2 [Alphaproteobacteria bacterium]|nr:MAG: error-prone DNA polymerase 2 [Alphaproteobacteria bacterium]